MKIAIIDYSGHPFQVQLSRELARRGHTVLHSFFSDFQTPKGHLTREADDPAGFSVEGVTLGVPFEKQSFVKRRQQEIQVGKKFVAQMRAFAPEVLITSNLPLDTLRVVQNSLRGRVRKFVFWQQDIYSVAIRRILKGKFGLAGDLIGRYYQHIERQILDRSSEVVVIAEDFVPILQQQFHTATGKVHVIENWAPLDEIPPQPKVNPWSEKHALADKKVVLYSGTLGMKHDPGLLLHIAEALKEQPDCRVVVASEGPGVEWLRSKISEHGLKNLELIGFQPFSEYPWVLGCADVLVGVLEKEAGVFSVPSKVLSYLCSGRPIVLSAPQENLAVRNVRNAKAGITVAPGDSDAMCDAVRKLLTNDALRAEMGRNSRACAEEKFDIRTIGDAFGAIIS